MHPIHNLWRPLLLSMLLVCSLASCSRNEFSVTIDQPQGFQPLDLTLAYYASDSKKGWMTFQYLDAPIGMPQQTMCATRNPAVVFLYSGHKLLTVFYARRGDKILLTCRNGLWQASGNQVSDSLSRWQAMNRNLIEANASTDLNRVIKKYVTANPRNTLSAILLYVYFDAAADPQQFRTLAESLKGDAADNNLKRALGVVPMPPRFSAEPLYPISLRSHNNRNAVVYTNNAKATLFIFWADREAHSRFASTIRNALRNNTDIRVADVNMQADTLNWTFTPSDSIPESWIQLWAPGAEQNSQLLPFALPAPDFLVVTDRSGRIIYHGSDARSAADSALKQ